MISKTVVLLAVSVALLATVSITPAQAQQAAPSGIVVSAAWLRATPKNAPVAGGYVTLTNKGDVADKLLGASLPIASEGQVHSMTMNNGVMHMDRLEGLAIAPGATVTLSPSGNHLMFMKPSMPLKEGMTLDGTLSFEKAGKVSVTFVVGGMAAKHAPGTPGHDMQVMPGMKGMDMKDMPAH